MKTSNIGLIGLAVMGENLALNMESKGFAVSVYNRTAGRGRRGRPLHERSWKRKEFYRNPYDTGIC
jgi:6-phosphogluconate dehydrogenase